MQDKKPPSQSRSAALLVVFSCIAGSVFLYKYHDVVIANPFKYLAYVVTVIAVGYKEIFKRDETTKKLQLQSFNHWVVPFVSVLAVCFFSAWSDVHTALESKQTGVIQQTQRQADESKHNAEEANRRAEISDLKRALAEQKLREVAIQGQSKQNQVVQVELAKRTSLEDRRQNEGTRYQIRRRALDQRELIAQKSLADVQRSVQGLKEIQAGFQRNEIGLRATGEAINRSVNQIESVKLSYVVTLPLDKPEMVAYRKKLDKVVIQFFLNDMVGTKSGLDDTGLKKEGTFYTAASGKKVSSLRVEILPNSPLYPSNFDPSFKQLLSYPVRLKITRKRGTQTSSSLPISDLNIETPPGATPQVFYFLGDDSVRLIFTGVTGLISKTTGNLWSLVDLDNSRVEVLRNNYDYTTKEFLDKPLPQLQRDCFLTGATFDINNSLYAFGGNNLSHHRDSTGAITTAFVFNLKKGAYDNYSTGPAGYF